MKQKELLENVRKNEACLVLANSSVEAVVLRRYQDGKLNHIRVDDGTPVDLEVPADCKRLLVVIEMEIEELAESDVRDAPIISVASAKLSSGVDIRSTSPLA
jgi:hypothetical protein